MKSATLIYFTYTLLTLLMILQLKVQYDMIYYRPFINMQRQPLNIKQRHDSIENSNLEEILDTLKSSEKRRNFNSVGHNNISFLKRNHSKQHDIINTELLPKKLESTYGNFTHSKKRKETNIYHSNDRFRNISTGKRHTWKRMNITFKQSVSRNNSIYKNKGLPFSAFKYPLDVDMVKVVADVKVNGSTKYKPINVYRHKFRINPKEKCEPPSSIFLVVMVKSAIERYEKRQAIRETWGNENILPTNTFKTIFILGATDKMSIQDDIDNEMKTYKDIVQINAIDTYFNNTLKTIGSLKWITEFCNNAEYAFLVDDDFYVATDLLVRYLLQLNRPKSLFMGRLWGDPEPQRGKFKKWKMSYKEYQYDRYPSFISAGAMIMSLDVVADFYIALQYTKLFRFDDVYLAIIAYKLSIKPQNNDRMRILKSDCPEVGIKTILAEHGFGDVRKLRKAWKIHQILEEESNDHEIPFRDFQYPLNVDMVELVRGIKMNLPTKLKPINNYSNIFLHLDANRKCSTDSTLLLLILVKSAASNFERRSTIRKTWGDEMITRRHKFVISFLVDAPLISSMNALLGAERNIYNDIVQIDAQDTSFSNNKTLHAIKWAATFCNKSKYVLITDDEFYIATDLLVHYLSKLNEKSFFMGRVGDGIPQRALNDIWRVSIQEYPYDQYPPFIGTGFMIMSMDVITDFSIAIPYIKNFKLDSIYLAIVAYKLRIIPRHNPDIWVLKKANYSDPKFRTVLASNKFDDIYEMRRAWEKRKRDYFIDKL